MAYSLKIHDPAFKQHIKNTKNYRYQFGFGLAIVAVAGFYLYGETSSEMDNPEALYIGLGIGGMFFLIGIYLWEHSRLRARDAMQCYQLKKLLLGMEK